MNKEDFYLRVAEIVGIEHNTLTKHPYYRRNRWNDRKPGNGRFEGLGIIRSFGGFVHIAINYPRHITTSCASHEEAIALLEEIFS